MKLGWVVGIATIVSVGGVAILQKRSGLLLESSKRCAKVPPGQVPYLRESLEFFPLTPTTLLALMAPAGPQFLNVEDGVAARTLHAYRIDLVAGTSARDPGLEKAISAWSWFSYRVSPNGRYMLCVPGDANRGGRVVDLVEKKWQPVDLPIHSCVAWLPDSSAFYAYTYEESGEALKALTRFSAPKWQAAETLPLGKVLTWGIQSAAWGPRPSVDSNGDLVVLASYQDTRTHPWRQTMHVRRLTRNGTEWSEAAKHEFDPPDMLIVNQDVRVSPDGTRLMWQGIKGGGTNKTWGLFTSDLDGSRRRFLGVVPMTTHSNSEPPPPSIEDQPLAVQPLYGAEWMPDGKTICFVADGYFRLAADR